MKISIAAFLIVFIVLSSTLLEVANAAYVAPSPSPSAGLCDEKCGQRCALKGRDSRCFKYCSMCCDKCHCVPSGTYGNKDECPCYRDWTSPNGRPKCP